MKIQITRKYDIQFDGTAVEFIALVDRELRLTGDSGLDSLDMGDAVFGATQLYDEGEMTNYVSISEDMLFDYIDCPDKDTLVYYFPETDTYMPTRAGVNYKPLANDTHWCNTCGQWAYTGFPIMHNTICPRR